MKIKLPQILKTIFLFSFLPTVLFAQDKPEISFKKPEQSIREPAHDDKGGIDIRIKVELKAKGGADANYPIKFKVKNSGKGSAASNDFSFTDTEELQIDKDGGTSTIWVEIKSDNDDIEANETIVLEIEENDDIIRGDTNVHTITIKEVANYELIRLTTGVDFDFQQNDVPLSFYGELNGFLPDLFKDRFGVSFSIFSDRLSAEDSLFSSQTLNFKQGDFIIMDEDTTVNVRKLILRPTEDKSTRNYGLRVAPMIKIAEGDKTKFFASLFFEGFISTVNRSITFDTLLLRTEPLTIQEFRDLPPNRIRTLGDSNQYYGNFGIGFPFRYISNKLDIRIIANFGKSFKSSLIPISSTIGGSIRQNSNSTFYNVRLSVMDRSFGITIGANVRSRFGNELPAVNIYIAKSFNFSDFAKF